ncbi:IS66 family transposase [Paralcaligenes ureilyticus]|jgi:transposase|uniref:Transposase n=1 Tax=Paralcaligenes ureilyticus TaxID=627131 RepID=A0A4R3M8G9_9BURK|nr:IS66 family transposase [Paralcaligenes ureilyticus]TCT09680.1 transposase [Paralcaligenes ureilyticus]
MPANALPNDIDTLKRMLVSRDETIAKLLAEIARLKRWQYGRSSERMSELMNQLQLALGDLPKVADEQVAPIVASADADATAGRLRDNVTALRRTPRAFPTHLPRETIVHAPTNCGCPHCGGQLRVLGEDISETLDYVPGYFKVHRHVRPRLACRACSHIAQAPAPSRPITRGMADAGLLAQVVVAKYADHTPLYRQEHIYRRAGVQLERATLAAWVRETSRLLEPLSDALGRYVRQADKIHTDDTPVPVLDPGRGKTRTGRLWTYVRDDRPAGSRAPPAVWYQYSPDRKSERPQKHLQGFSGILQADAYSGYGALYRAGQIVEAGCWAHARRKFYDLFKLEQSPTAQEALARIGALYAIERDIRGCAVPLRQSVRQRQAAPLLTSLKAWLECILMKVSAKSELAKAIKYALGHWTALTRYCDDGRIEIDNNTAERSIRPLVIGRRNYLFAGSDGGGRSAAVIYSLIGTARLNDVEPYAYLRAVFERIADHPINQIDELLPWHLDLQNDTLPKAA